MSEQISEKTREREPLRSEGYENLMASREEFIARQLTAKPVIKSDDREWTLCRQGYVKFYLNPTEFSDTMLSDWCVFTFDVRKQSGKHKHQGGLIIFPIEGEGATEVNGELLEWKAGDMILLPIEPGGCEHKHYQRGDKPATWLAILYMPQWDHCGSEMTQVELSSEFLAAFGSKT